MIRSEVESALIDGGFSFAEVDAVLDELTRDLMGGGTHWDAHDLSHLVLRLLNPSCAFDSFVMHAFDPLAVVTVHEPGGIYRFAGSDARRCPYFTGSADGTYSLVDMIREHIDLLAFGADGHRKPPHLVAIENFGEPNLQTTVISMNFGEETGPIVLWGRAAFGSGAAEVTNRRGITRTFPVKALKTLAVALREWRTAEVETSMESAPAASTTAAPIAGGESLAEILAGQPAAIPAGRTIH